MKTVRTVRIRLVYFTCPWRIYTISIVGFLTYIYGDLSVYNIVINSILKCCLGLFNLQFLILPATAQPRATAAPTATSKLSLHLSMIK